jgi:hypothetical protein
MVTDVSYQSAYYQGRPASIWIKAMSGLVRAAAANPATDIPGQQGDGMRKNRGLPLNDHD